MKELLTMMQHLRQPEYVHVLLNPMPLYGMAAGAFALAWSRLRKQEFPEGALVWIIFVALVTGFAVYFGERGFENAGVTADAHGNRWLARHKERAEILMYVFYLTGLSAAATLFTQRRHPPTALRWIRITFLLTCASIVAAIWISHAGGQVIHTEFR